jgi:inorganic triphosphatase YgiF
MAIEVESKFRAFDQLTLQRLSTIDHLGPGLLGPASVAHEFDRYLDTADRRLAAGGWACRLRTRADRTIVSLKGTAASSLGDWSGLHRRPETEGPASVEIVPDDWPPSEALDLLLELTGGAPLRERLRLEQRRTERPVLVDRRRVATLSLDQVHVLDPVHGSVGRLLVVELEHAGGAREEELVAVAEALRADTGLTPDPLTKLEHATRLIADAQAHTG